jgi:alpha-ketoglutarate-dependent taurine dioxygenase
MPIYTGKHANHERTTLSYPATATQTMAGASPFSLQDKEAYHLWREQKLHAYPEATGALVVEVRDPRALTETEAGAILRVCRKTNMAIYASQVGGLEDKTIPRALGERFGLQRLDNNMLADDDGITSLQVVPGKSQRGYIPYSNRRLLWHTDGYYNSPESFIRAFVLHCVSPAAEGGENSLLDHEIVYILLRDANPDYIQALMAPEAMTIPANTESGEETRAASTGPVFAVDIAGNLHMRYTARTRSIVWKQDDMTQAAVRFLENLLSGDSRYVFHHRLAPGQGLICNNVLHNRTGFTDDMDKGITRLVYRARYYDRIRGTNLSDISG